jgi:hypothetical protein
MKPLFNKQHWIDELKREAGLSHVSYDELSEHSISFDIFGKDDTLKRNAKDYIDEQLKSIEDQYNNFDESLDLDSLRAYVEDDTIVTSTGEMFGDVETTLIQIPEIPQEIQRNNMHYYEVDIDGRTHIVVINDHGDDFRIKDHINHVKQTSFFVEERDPRSLTGHEMIISYYQFANAIQSHLKQNVDLSAYEKISKDINTVFDGVKLEGF